LLDDPDSVTLPLPEALPVILSVPLKETLEVSERETVPLVEGVWLSAGVEVAVAEKDSLTLCEPEGVIENDEEWLEEEVSERELLSEGEVEELDELVREGDQLMLSEGVPELLWEVLAVPEMEDVSLEVGVRLSAEVEVVEAERDCEAEAVGDIVWVGLTDDVGLWLLTAEKDGELVLVEVEEVVMEAIGESEEERVTVFDGLAEELIDNDPLADAVTVPLSLPLAEGDSVAVKELLVVPDGETFSLDEGVEEVDTEEELLDETDGVQLELLLMEGVEVAEEVNEAVEVILKDSDGEVVSLAVELSV
jgi:hypothetical protein